MRAYLAAVAIVLSVPAQAQEGDELRPVPASVLLHQAYPGAGAPSEIEFINARRAPVRLYWIEFDGAPRLYATIPPGGEVLQPTFVSHRWLVAREGSDAPVAAFISSRADLHGDGQAQLAIIR